MLNFILWYLLITLLGFLAFPLTFKLLPGLADRGYTLARTLGLLIWSYVFWILGSFGLLQNDLGGGLFALLVLIFLTIWAYRSLNVDDIRSWLGQKRRMIMVVEALFFLAFLGWTIVRSANPEITGTEKPMELAFINAILRSPSLPPNDPWLSGYSISYYYYGYLMVAMLARLTATAGGTAFNLGLALVFGLSAIGSYGLLHNLLATWQRSQRLKTNKRQSPFPPLIGPFFVLIVSNLSGFLHFLRVNGVFWQKSDSGEWVSPFWVWLDIGSISQPPPENPFYHWWWWQGSRIVQDYTFDGSHREIIDEFPFFSFLLGDLHPHVLAMPFAFLAMSLALNLLLGGSRGRIRWFGIPLNLNWFSFGLAAFALGAMGFLNTWDFPFYVALFAAAYMLVGWKNRKTDEPFSTIHPTFFSYMKDFLGMGFSLGVTGGLLFLPFYLGFSSQAGGFIPNLIYITRGVYIWVHFAVLLIPLFGMLFYLWEKHGNRQQLIIGIKVTLTIIAILLAITALLTVLISILHNFSNMNSDAAIAASAFLGSLASPGWSETIIEGLSRRLKTPGTMLTLVLILIMVIALLWPRHKRQEPLITSHYLPKAHVFVLLVSLIATLLVLVPEFFFLRDFFGWRINTIFKFYFLVWLFWSIAAAYATLVLWKKLEGTWGLIFKLFMGMILTLSMFYPVMGLWSKTNGFKPAQWELDGTAYLTQFNPDEATAIEWLWNAPLGTIIESVGGSYSAHARISTHSGQPTVLGWVGHEHQWRGGFEEMGTRQEDIAHLYCAANWLEILPIITQYDIHYIVVGNLERTTYTAGSANCPSGLNDGKFQRYLEPVFQQGSLTIYQIP